MASRHSNRRGLAVLAALAAVLGLAVGTQVAQVAQAPRAEAFSTPYWFSQAHGEHEKITRAALACPEDQPSDGVCFEEDSMDVLAGYRSYWGGVNAPDLPAWLGGYEADNPAAHCDNADYIRPEDNEGAPYPRTRAEASDQLVACLQHLRNRFHGAADNAGQVFDDDGELSNWETQSACTDTAPPGEGARAKCRFVDLFGRTLHGVQDFYSHSNWVDRNNGNDATDLENPPGMYRSEVFPLMSFRLPLSPPSDVPEQLATGCFPSDECEGRIKHDETLNKDTAEIDPVTGQVTLDGTSARGQILDNQQRAVTWAIADTRRQWAAMRDEIRARYGEERGETIICALTHDTPVANWPWTTGDCEA
ncbi:hypothetical protein C8K30_101584 [Promicromonospora sp. AC04]|uniref:CinY protein n=1 Tax=Promicromonospora sp. AC04 TaxID=2135723 RepID=UPI000D3318B6|nr:CinY protein [Promicromonospora sp. AC04]PUB32064.1 hypothetical protein C8K30_101584 [Promicromonospora sp. AC04]